MLRSSRAALLAALVSLGLLQVAAVGHSAEHAVEEVGETCEVCLKFSEIKTSFSDTGTDSVVPCAAEDYDAIPHVASVAAPARSTRIRAPPPLV